MNISDHEVDRYFLAMCRVNSKVKDIYYGRYSLAIELLRDNGDITREQYNYLHLAGEVVEYPTMYS